jgi:tetratricopeptide (TPR) repeat protein
MRKSESGREKRIAELVEESLRAYEKYTQLRQLYREGRLSFSSVEDFVDDRGKSCLFRLKELSHELFRNDEAGYRERLFDMLIGYTFHEAMKLRENLYQIEFYKPKLVNLLHFRREIVDEMRELTERAEKRLKEGIRQIGVLMRQLRTQLADRLRHYGTGYLMPRLLFEQRNSMKKVLGKKTFEVLLKEIYGEGKNALVMEAAKSYLKSQYYEQARKLFKRCLFVDRENPEVLFLFRYASAFHFFFRGNARKALYFAKEALSTKALDFIEYRRDLRSLLAEIDKDVGGGHANL